MGQGNNSGSFIRPSNLPKSTSGPQICFTLRPPRATTFDDIQEKFWSLFREMGGHEYNSYSHEQGLDGILYVYVSCASEATVENLAGRWPQRFTDIEIEHQRIPVKILNNIGQQC